MQKNLLLLLIISIIALSSTAQSFKFLDLNKVKQRIQNKDEDDNIYSNNLSVDIKGRYHVYYQEKDGNMYTFGLQFQGDETYVGDESNQIVQKLTFSFEVQNNNEFTFRIQPADGEGDFFELPHEKPFSYEKNMPSVSKSQNFDVVLPQNEEQFSFQVKSLEGEIIFDFSDKPMVVTRQYIAYASTINNEYVWGWGQQRGVYILETGSYSIWNYDNPGQMNSKQPGQETYGTHPVLLVKTGKQYFMSFLRNTYGMELDYAKNDSLNYQIAGGIIEMKFFVYDTPDENIARYSDYINNWSLPPFWAMGLHLCKWGLDNSTQWKQVWDNAETYMIPFDTLWSDIDYMQDYEDFTISTDYNVDTMKQVTNRTEPKGVHWIPIIDAGVAYKGDSGLRGVTEGLFINSVQTNEPLIGCVWPGPAYFVDFNNPAAEQFWIDGLKNITEVYNGPQPSGIWLDMNDPSSFTDDKGQVYNPDECGDWQGKVDNESQSFLDSVIEKFGNESIKKVYKRMIKKSENNGNDWGYVWSPLKDQPMQFKTIATDATHYDKSDSQYIKDSKVPITEFELHNLYAFFEQIPTRKYLKHEAGYDLPFIVSRSSYVGSGKHSSLWTGDNEATWEQLKTSIGDVLNFQIFQIPMLGPDVCGFTGDTGPELCARWYQAGAFYPFYRSHSSNDSIEQFPWSFPDYPYVLESARDSIYLRYSLLKWYYSKFVAAFPNGSIYRPLFFDYPQDENSIVESHQILIGSEIMVTPVLDPSSNPDSQSTTFKLYFPGDENTYWYRYQQQDIDDKPFVKAGTVDDFNVRFKQTCPFWIRSGAIIFQQTQYLQEYQKHLRTRYLDNEFQLNIAFDHKDQAQGEILGVPDFDESTIAQYCLGDNHNCLITMTAEIDTKNKTITLTAKPQGNNPTQWSFYVKALRLLRENTYLGTSAINFKFSNNQLYYQFQYE